MVPRYEIVPIPPHLRNNLAKNSIEMFPAETAQSMFDFRADDVVGKIAPRPLLLIHAANDSVTPTEQSVELFKHAHSPPSCICSARSTTSCSGGQRPGVGRYARLAWQVLSGKGVGPP